MNPSFALATVAGFAAVFAEWCYKQHWAITGGWWKYVWLWIPLQLLIGYCVYKMVNIPGANVLDAVIAFALVTAILRIILVTCLLHQAVPIQSWIGFGLVVAATLVKGLWEKFA